MKMKIGAMAKRTECSVETIRFYEKEGLLPAPGRTEGNFRLYNETHAEQLLFIRRCRSLDMSLEEIRLLLKSSENPLADCSAVNALLDEHIDGVAARMAELERLSEQLRVLRQQCGAGGTADQCGILQGLGSPGLGQGALPQARLGAGRTGQD